MSEAVNNIDRPKTNDDMHAGNMNLKVREREKPATLYYMVQTHHLSHLSRSLHTRTYFIYLV